MADRLADLLAAKALMWESVEAAPVDKRGPLMAQWRALESDVAALEAELGKAGDPIDEIAARRAARGGATARARRAEGGSG